MVANRFWRTFSAFDRSTRRTQQRLSLTLISWNLDAFSSRPVSRAKLILAGHDSISILEVGTGEIPRTSSFSKKVTPDVRASLLDDLRVRAALLVTDAEDQNVVRGRAPLRP